jgi:hypothetical protein
MPAEPGVAFHIQPIVNRLLLVTPTSPAFSLWSGSHESGTPLSLAYSSDCPEGNNKVFSTRRSFTSIGDGTEEALSPDAITVRREPKSMT